MSTQTDPDIEGGEAIFKIPYPQLYCSPPMKDTDIEGRKLYCSPADTFDTTLTSPSTFDSLETQQRLAPLKISFDHHVKSSISSKEKRKGRSGLILGLSKPLLSMIFLILLMLGLLGYFLNGWLMIPQLRKEIERLESQVDRLNVEVDRLGSENDRYQSLNDQLNATVVELGDIVEDLNTTIIQLEYIKNDLNVTNKQLGQRVEDLSQQNESYSKLNENLNYTAGYLMAEVMILKETLEQLILENDSLSNLTDHLSNMKDHLSNVTVEQNTQLLDLKETLAGFVEENQKLEKLNSDLLSIANLLNTTSLGLGNSLEEIADFLSNQIIANQALVLVSLENSYRQKISAWDCDFQKHFFSISDFNEPISDLHLTTVLEYVNDRVLSELCLSLEDFEKYLSEKSLQITTYRLIKWVNEYSSLALDFMFPEDNEGLSLLDWQDANYKCENLHSSIIIS